MCKHESQLSFMQIQIQNKMSISNISIIGGLGEMGQFFSKRFQKLGVKVNILDKPLSADKLQNTIPQIDMILLSVPVLVFEYVLHSLRPYLNKSTILMDICSVKVKPLQLMLENHSGPVVGTHPLFGPQPESESQLRIALVSGREQTAFAKAFSIMKSLGLVPFETNADEHDKALAYIQGLNFVTTISYLASMAHESEIEKFLTPSFYRRLDAARKMLTEDSELFQNIFEENPYSLEAIRHFRSFLNLAAAGELDLLQDKANWWWRRYDERDDP